uniref:TctD transcriptional regulator n=1 Tax=Plocamium cartilagineum TaxID=31452 RepID=A0A1C9CI04_PLOCA|nr:hypothetical protein Plocam_146 [Plocamium cartilagineum]AOM67982.1 hypothetical protein Plocam_146 [Plocamium cartilagineum]
MLYKLLLVDDDLFLRDSISSYLINEGFEVDTADSVKSALIKLETYQPDIIIADIMMSCLDGYDLIKILRKDNKFLAIPIIFLTAKGMTNDRIIGYNLGCSAYLTKPFNPRELVSIINSIIKNINFLNSSKSNSINYISNHERLSQKISSSTLDNLTYREYTILRLVVKGFMNKEIALHLNLSIRNIEKYVSRLLNKTNTRNRTELTKFALSQNIDFTKGE